MAPTENDIKSAANWSLLLGVLILIGYLLPKR